MDLEEKDILSLSFTRTYKVLFAGTSEATGDWIPLGNAYNNVYNALYTVSLETGDWGRLQGSIQPFPSGPTSKNINSTADYNPFVVSIAVVSATNVIANDGPFYAVRFVKVGNAGACKVATYG